MTSDRELFEEQRGQSTARWGALTLDNAWTADCATTSANSPYSDFASLLDFAKTTLESMSPGGAYYAFHSGFGADIVIELRRGHPLATRVSLHGRERLLMLTEAEERVLAADAALRDVAG